MWIEGIGTTLEHLMKTDPMIPNYGWLVSVEVNGKTIFTREDLSNALTSIQVRTINYGVFDGHDVYDLQGADPAAWRLIYPRQQEVSL